MNHTGGTVKKKGAVESPPGEYFEVLYADPASTTKTYVKGDVSAETWALLQEAWDKDRVVESEHDAVSGALVKLAISKA